MANIKENQNLLNEKSNEIEDEEFYDTELPPPPSSTKLNLLLNTNNNSSTNNNNNRHIVTFGILIIFITLYITVAAFSTKSNNKSAENLKLEILKECDKQKSEFFLNKYLEPKEDICHELEIFLKSFECQVNANEEEKEEEKDTEIVLNDEIMKNNNNNNNIKAETPTIEFRRKRINGKKSLIKNGQNGKRNKSKMTRKPTNKNSTANKKDEIKKKSSSAEPIIYLFALVLIYLLFKAISDINQHYKTQQAKGDKRIRRCSLQSYAQAHKHERRASKDQQFNALKHKYQLLEQKRTQSLDRYEKPTLLKSNENLELLSRIQKQVSIDETILSANLKDTQLQLKLEQNILINKKDQRRCSVPVLSIADKSKSLSNTMISTINRRTSLVYGGKNLEPTDPLQFPLQLEPKRRVRMINRH